jgi:seryl-tRNA synthetase
MSSKKQKILKKLKNKYRLVLLNDGSLQDVFSIRLTPMNVLMLLSSSLLLFTLVIFLLIAFTPLRQLVPGYGKVSDNAAIIELTQQVDELTRQQEQNQQKQEALQKILGEDERSLDSAGMKRPVLRK